MFKGYERGSECVVITMADERRADLGKYAGDDRGIFVRQRGIMAG